MFCQIFFSPQVKQCAIITYKHGVFVPAHECPNNLRLLENLEIRKYKESLKTS